MKLFSKILAIALVFVSFSSVANAQTTEREKSGRFQFGINYRNGITGAYVDEQAVTLSGGYRFNRKNYLGINAGVSDAEYYNDADGNTYSFTGVPVALDYIHYFPIGKARNHSIFLGGEAGVLCSSKTVTDNLGEEIGMGTAFLTLKTGVDFKIYKRLHLNCGVRLGLVCAEFSCGISF